MASTISKKLRNWIPCSKRRRKELKELVNMEESKVMRVQCLTFVPDKVRFQKALTGRTEVLLRLRDDGIEVAIKKMFKPNFNKLWQVFEVFPKLRCKSPHVMQYLNSTSDSFIVIYEEFIKERQPAVSKMKIIAREFHEKSMIHQDIKPHKVLIENMEDDSLDILETMRSQDLIEQFGQSSQDSSTGSTNQTVRAETGVTEGVHTLTLESSKEVNRLSSATSSATGENRRKWIPCSERWRKELEELANMEESEVTRVGGLTFVPDEERFQIALTGQTEVLLGLRDDGTEIAIKRMFKSNFKKLQQQLEVLRKHRFNSLHVVQYVDFTSDSHCGYIALQLSDFNLEEFIKERQPADSERKRIAREFLQGLKDLHEKNVIHQDIKPQNVFIDIDGRVRLADFGINRIVDLGQTSMETDWEATEIIRSEPEDKKSQYKLSTDIQVAGMLVYYIISGGKHPFGDDALCQTNILDGKYTLEHLTDEEAKDLVGCMININPKERPSITEVLEHHYFWKEDSFLPLASPGQREADSSFPIQAEGQEPDAPAQRKMQSEPRAPLNHHNPRQNFFCNAALESRLPLALDPILSQLLFDLERLSVMGYHPGEDQNLFLITMMQKKGARAQQVFYKVLKEVDPYLVDNMEG